MYTLTTDKDLVFFVVEPNINEKYIKLINFIYWLQTIFGLEHRLRICLPLYFSFATLNFVWPEMLPKHIPTYSLTIRKVLTYSMKPNINEKYMKTSNKSQMRLKESIQMSWLAKNTRKTFNKTLLSFSLWIDQLLVIQTIQ